MERNARRTLEAFDTLTAKIAALPEEGEVCLHEEGQGEFSLLAALTKKRLHIVAEMDDENLLALADNCASKPANLTYRSLKQHSGGSSANAYRFLGEQPPCRRQRGDSEGFAALHGRKDRDKIIKEKTS